MASVFIVEDDENLRNLYSKALRIRGFEIIDTAIDGADAVAKFRTFEIKPDVIIMDYRMPNKNGLDASIEILKIDNAANIVVASADRTAIPTAKSIGIKYFLEKPFSFTQLHEIINQSLKSKEIIA